MNTITPTDQQVAHLNQHGTLLWVVPVEPGVRHDGDTYMWPDPSGCPYGAMIGHVANMADDLQGHAPHQPGDVVAIGKHEWDDVGERCLKCGDKDWFAGPVCDSADRATITSVSAMWLHDVGLDLIAWALGIDPEEHTAGDIHRAWNEQHPQHDWHTSRVVWVIELEFVA